MKSIRTLLVDDEFLALNLLENFSQRIPDIHIVNRVKSPMDALHILQHQSIDLLFLDIQMPTLPGNQLLKSLPNPPVAIFTTAYSEYALEAFELNAVDYLLKPFSFDRFVQAINKARKHLNPPTTIANYTSEASPKSFWTAKVDGKVVKIFFQDILFVEGLKEYVRVVTGTRKYVTLESLKNLETLLPPPAFVRVHKSYIVAKDRVHSLEGNLLHLGEHRIPISRNRREEIMQQLFYQ